MTEEFPDMRTMEQVRCSSCEGELVCSPAKRTEDRWEYYYPACPCGKPSGLPPEYFVFGIGGAPLQVLKPSSNQERGR